jgi:hypothetical protein
MGVPGVELLGKGQSVGGCVYMRGACIALCGVVVGWVGKSCAASQAGGEQAQPAPCGIG